MYVHIAFICNMYIYIPYILEQTCDDPACRCGQRAAAFTRRSISDSVCVAANATRTRADPTGTVGGRIATARLFACSARNEAASSASPSSPSRASRGMMCVCDEVGNERRTRAALLCSRARSCFPSSPVATFKAADAAATTGTGSAVGIRVLAWSIGGTA